MTGLVAGVRGGFQAELLHLRRAPLLVALAVAQAVTFLLLVSLFGLTGSRAPTALVMNDYGIYARRLVADLRAAHHSFDLRPMEAGTARALLNRGDLVAMITIPRGFSRAVARGETVPLPVSIDNVDVDLTEDIQRALPSAIVAFGRQSRFPNLHVRPAELDLIGHDTGFIPYLVVSALALDALVVAGILGGVAVAREFESGTVHVLAAAPIPAIAPLAGRLLATALVSSLAMAITALVVATLYGVIPNDPLSLAGGLLACVIIFTCLGAAAGAALRRTLPVAPLIFGFSLPLYIDSGALEPERFDGATIWMLAHLSPLYYAVGVLEDAAHGLQVTPEPVGVDALALAGWAAAAAAALALLLRRVNA